MKNHLALYEKLVWKNSKNDSLNYRFGKPNNIKPKGKYPLLFFLHGAGGRGYNNNDQLLDAGSIEAFSKQNLFSKYGSYLVAAQVPYSQQWVDVRWDGLIHQTPKISKTMEMTLELLDSIIHDHSNYIDINRIYILGISMGGYGVWDAIHRRPHFFAAAIPICGGGDISSSKLISHLPIWAWHGEQDPVINVKRSREMYDAVNNDRGNIKYTEVKGRGHDVWLDAWRSKDLWNWIYSQTREIITISIFIYNYSCLKILQ